MAKFEIEFEDALPMGRRFPLLANTDEAIDEAIKAAGLWKHGEPYPYFEVFEDGEWNSGGGGTSSGEMTDPTKTVLGHTFRPMSKTDWDAFAGAEEGTLICSTTDVILLLEPNGSITEIDPETGNGTVWAIRENGYFTS